MRSKRVGQICMSAVDIEQIRIDERCSYGSARAHREEKTQMCVRTFAGQNRKLNLDGRGLKDK